MTTTLGTRLGTILGSDLATFTDGLAPPPSFDASKQYALTNYLTSNRYTTPAGGGEAGDVAGFGMLVLGFLEKIPAATQTIASRVTAASGYTISTDPTAPSFVATSARDGGGVSVGTRLNTGLTFAASDVGRVVPVSLTYGGGFLSTFAWDGSVKRSTALATYSPAAGTTFTQMGPGGTDTAYAPFAVLTYRGTPTDAQLRAVLAAARTVGDVPTKAAAEALMPMRYGVATLTASNYLQTAAGAGIAGAAGGFHVIGRIRIDGLSGTEVYFGRDNLSNAGWRLGRSGVTLNATFASGAGAPVNTASFTVPSAGIYHIALQHTGAAVQLWVNGTQVGADQPIAGYTPLAGARTIVGNVSASFPALTVAAFDLAGGHSVLTAAEIRQSATTTESTGIVAIAGKTEHLWSLHADIAANGNAVPATFLDRVGTDHLTTVGTPTVTSYGATVTHRWSLRDVLLAANVPVADGAAAPAAIPDSVTAAPVDAMAKSGSPVVRVIDPSVDGRVTYGALGFSDTNYLEAAAGIRGAATGFTLLFAVRFDAATAGSVVLISNYTATPTGYTVYTNSGQIRIFRAGSGDLVLGTATAADAGTPKLVGVTWDGTTWRAYDNGVAGASGAATMVFGASAWRLGAYLTGSGSGTGVSSQFAVSGCDVALSPAEIASVYADWQATGRLRLPSGKINSHVYDLTQDIVANGGPENGIPAQVLDRVGTDHLTRVGTDLRVAQRREQLWSYETTPILRGLETFSDANYYLGPNVETANYANGWWGCISFCIPTLTVTSQTRDLLATYVANQGGFLVRFSGALSMVALNGAIANDAVNSGASHSLAAADVGKLMVLIWTWDTGQLRFRSMIRRVETAGSIAAVTYKPSTNNLWIGREVLTVRDANGIQWFGAMLGEGILSTAEMQALHDAVIAADGRMVAPAGRTPGLLIEATDDIAGGGSAPATLTNKITGATYARTGSPTVVPRYARAFG